MQEETEKIVPISLWDIDSNYQLLNEKKYMPPALTEIGNHQLFSSEKCVAIEISSLSKNIVQIDFTGASGTKIAGKDQSSSEILSSEISIKSSQNLVAITTINFPWFYKTDGTLLFPTDGEKKYKEDIFAGHTDVGQIRSIYSHSFHPEDSNTQVIICGSSTFIGIIDTSTLSNTPATLDKDYLLYAKQIYNTSPTPKYVTENKSFYRIEYNFKKTTEFLTILSSLSNAKHAGYYLGYDSTDISQKGFIDANAHGLTYGSTSTVRNFIGTYYFLTVLTANIKLINTSNKLGIVDTGTIAGDGKIDYMLITDQVVPIAGLNGAYPIFAERIDPEKNIWIIGGGSDNKLTDEEAYGGWYKILEIEPPKCHADCATCINEYTIDPANCLTCSDSTPILGTSGCNCSANCLSCSENNNPQKCKACSKGYYLKDDDDDGIGECVEGQTALSTCTTAKTDLEEEKSTLEDKVKELEGKISSNGGNGKSNNGGESQQQNPPYTTINGVSIPGCVLANQETGLCKLCARGYAKDTTNEDEDATTCTWCGVEGCDKCIVRQGDGKKQCTECLHGLELKENDGVQTCLGYLLRFWVLFCLFYFILLG